MMHYIFGVIFILGILTFLYYLKSKTSKTKSEFTTLTFDPKKDDIVLASVHNDEDISYAILWNGKPGTNYFYTITDSEVAKNDPVEAIIAKGDVICPSSGLVKIKDVPIVEKTQYQIHINETSIDAYFEPPKFTLPLKISDQSIECDTNIVPTNMELLISGKKVPLSKCKIKIDPEDPGFICEAGGDTLGSVTAMVYNGPNVVTIYTSKR